MNYETILDLCGYGQVDSLLTMSAKAVDTLPYDLVSACVITGVTPENWEAVVAAIQLRKDKDLPVTVLTGAAADTIYFRTCAGALPDTAPQVLPDTVYTLVLAPDIAGEDTPFTLEPLQDVLAALRGPNGCPWDKMQTHASLRRYLLEEVYETLEAIDEENPEHLKEELGDVLLQIVFHARVAEEAGHFTLQDVVQGIVDKMKRRHPHVFTTMSAKTAGQVALDWEALKQLEKKKERKSILDGVSTGLPALLRAQKLQEKAAKVGFDWDCVDPAWDKFAEEIAEFKAALTEKNDKNKELEAGDVLFSLINLLRWYKISGENALNLTNNKFQQRFAHVERRVAEKKRPWETFTLDELDAFWDEAKMLERTHSD